MTIAPLNINNMFIELAEHQHYMRNTVISNSVLIITYANCTHHVNDLRQSHAIRGVNRPTPERSGANPFVIVDE